MNEGLIEFKVRLLGGADVDVFTREEFLVIESDEAVAVKIDDILSITREREVRTDCSNTVQYKEAVRLSIMTRRSIVYRLYCDGEAGAMSAAKDIWNRIIEVLCVANRRAQGVEERTANAYKKKYRRARDGVDAIEVED